MSKRKLLMMLTVMLITILTASGFYILTGEASIDKVINVVSSKTEDGDWKKVYEAGAPYGSKDNPYYIKYTGKDTGRTTVDLEEAKAGLTIDKDTGYPVIFNQKITSTYKMFSKDGSDTDPKNDVTRVFIPDTIAIDNDGIASNTFDGTSGSQEIDCIYRTGDITKSRTLANKTTLSAKSLDPRGRGIDSDYDKTGKITKSNVKVFVCLDDKNILRKESDAVYTSSYKGIPKNVYVSNSVAYPSHLFSLRDDDNTTDGDGEKLEYALLDSGITWNTNKQELSFLFNRQTNLKMRNSFRLPANAYGSMTGAFQSCNSIKSLPDDFALPNGITSTDAMFRYCKFTDLSNLKSFKITSNVTSAVDMFSATTVTKLPSSFKLPKGIENVQGMFWKCHNLESIPNNFTIPESVTNVYGMFYNNYKLSGTVVFNTTKVPSTYESTSIFYNAGRDVSSKLHGYNTPIVMKYSNDCASLKSYMLNVLTPTQSGKVTKVPVTSPAGWVKSSNDSTNGKNSDDNGETKYYVHYTGSTSIIDLDSDSFDKTSDGYPAILGTRIYNTSMMFSNNNSITRVVVPSTIAIDSDGIATNTFSGTTQEVDMIYHTGTLASKDQRGSTIKGTTLNKTTKTMDGDVKIFVYLGDENIATRTSEHATTSYTYNGEPKNVFLSNNVAYPSHFFDYYGKGTLLNYALLDNGKTWNEKQQELSYLFNAQSSLKIRNNFKLPDNAYGEMDCFFRQCTGIETLPPSFELPYGIKSLQSFFVDCKITDLSSLKSFTIPPTVKAARDLFSASTVTKLPSSFKLPKGIENVQGMFWKCHNLESIPNNFTIPESVTNVYGMFYNNYKLSGTVVFNTTKVPSTYESTSIFYNAGRDTSSKASGCDTPILMWCYQNSSIDAQNASSNFITKKYLASSQPLDNQSQPVVISDSADDEDTTIDSSTNQEISGDKVVIEDETKWVTVTVTKSVDETVTDIQASSASIENTSEENKSEGDEAEQ